MDGSRAGRVVVHGVSISHPGRVIDSTIPATKLDVARYYEAIAEAMLPHVAGRPLTLVHCPAGLAAGCRYMKHSKVWAPPAVRAPRHDWSLCLAFARGFAETLERHAPARYTTAYARRGRDRKILIDYLRNNRTNTSVAAFSTRARQGLPVSVPIAWEELDPRHPPRWNLQTVPRRLRTLRADPWAGYASRRQRLSRALLQAVGTVATVAGGGATMRMLLAILVAFGAALPGRARAEDGAGGEGRIQTDEVTIEIVRPHRGRVIETPEGYLRVEEGPDLDDSNDLGSFGTYHAAALDAEVSGTSGTGAARPAPSANGDLPDSLRDVPPTPLRPDGLVDTTAPIPGPDPCRAQRGKYLRRLLEMSGVKVDRPLELLDGLSGPGGDGGGNVLGTGYISPGVDPLKPLAWDQELRSLGRDLAACQARVATARP